MLGKTEGKRRRGGREGDGLIASHCLIGHEFEPTLGDNAGQGSLVCCSPWGHQELDMT